MNVPFFKSIRAKVSLFVLLLLVATTLIFYLITAQIMKQHVLQEVLRRAESLSLNIGVSAGYSMLSRDLLGLDNMAFRTKSANPDIEYVVIVDKAMKIIAHSDIKEQGRHFRAKEGSVFRQYEGGAVARQIASPSGDLFEIERPVVFMGRQLGSVMLGVNKSVLEQAQRAVHQRILFALGVILGVGIIGSFVLSSVMTKPVQELATGVSEMKQGKRTRPLLVYANDELGELTGSFNEMTSLITAQQDKLREYARNLEESYVSTVKVIAATLDARDPYTHGHSTRVSLLSLQLAGKIGLGSEELEDLEVACLFHDIGKIRIPDDILRKKGPLSPDEYRKMMRHTEYGAEILKKAPSLHKYIASVRHHHEWFDGTGYPDGLAGEKIPLFASIISISDTYDAMTSSRPYRPALAVDAAAEELMRGAGSQFSPDMVTLFLEIINKYKIPDEYYDKPALP